MKIGYLGAALGMASTLAGCTPVRTDVALPGGAPRALAVGDVNGDGKAEVIVGHRLAHDAAGGLSGASLLTPAEGETFRAQLVDAVDFEPDRLELVDLDGDGKLDLLAVEGGGAGKDGSVHVLLGHGDGTFTAVDPLRDVGHPLALAAGDLDGDGKMDIVLSSLPPGAPLQVFHGLGGGAFGPPDRSFDVDPSAHLAVGDVNGDGRAEVVMGSRDGHVDVVLQERGRLLAPVRTKIGEGDVAVALGDLKGDHKLEIVAVAEGTAAVSIVTGLGTRFNVDAVRLPHPATDVAVGDVDGDGKLEIVAIDRERSQLTLLAPDAGGHYHRAFALPAGERPAALALGNLHGDGQLDAVTANERGGSVSVIHFFHRR
jgi:FG-GAP-like repeat/FG-GAP repeat